MAGGAKDPSSKPKPPPAFDSRPLIPLGDPSPPGGSSAPESALVPIPGASLAPLLTAAPPGAGDLDGGPASVSEIVSAQDAAALAEDAIEGGPKKTPPAAAPVFKDVSRLNGLKEKAVGSTELFYERLNTVRQGQIPVTLVVDVLAAAVVDFATLKDELWQFDREGLHSLQDVADELEQIVGYCRQVTDMVKSDGDTGEILAKLERVSEMCQKFLEIVGAKCKQLQSLRVRTARTWLYATSFAGITVGSCAAALTMLSGGAAAPVLAPAFAFSAGTASVVAASQVAFGHSLGAEIRDMDEQLAQLETFRMQARHVDRTAQQRRALALPDQKPSRWSLW